jgi:fucose permease
MLLIVGAGIVSNAIICAVFSAVTDRYQGRVIWVLPVICMAMMLSRERNRALGALLNKPIHFSEPHL